MIFKPEVLSDSPVFKVYSGVRKILPYVHQRQKSGFLREKGTCLGPLAWWAPPCLGGDGGEPGKELHGVRPSHSSHLLQMAGDGLRGLQQPSVRAGDGYGEETLQKWKLLQVHPSCGRVCCLRKLLRRRGAIGSGMLCQGSLLHWR